MANDDIKDLIGRYATGSLSAEEQKRLFDAALDDQDLFNEIAQEQDIKQLLAEPGARDRLIHALQPPPRRTAWIFGVSATAALTAVIAIVLMRPAPKTQQVAIVKNPPVSAETAPSVPPAEAATTVTAPAPKPPDSTPLADKRRAGPQPSAVAQSSGVPQPVKQKTADEPAREASKDVDSVEKREKKSENKVEDRKETDQVAAAAPVAAPPPAAAPATVTPSPAPPAAAARASAPSAARVGEAIQSPLQQLRMSGPRQQAQQKTQSNNQQSVGGAAGGLSKASSADVVETPAFGFHYSVETKGHLILVPAADGYLTVKSSDGAALFARKRVAAGIVIDLALPDGTTSVSVTFAASALPLSPAPVVRTDPEGTVQGASRLAVEIRINN
jgi:hypothetical protein